MTSLLHTCQDLHYPQILNCFGGQFLSCHCDHGALKYHHHGLEEGCLVLGQHGHTLEIKRYRTCQITPQHYIFEFNVTK